jgi:hypothetical protein
LGITDWVITDWAIVGCSYDKNKDNVLDLSEFTELLMVSEQCNL